MAETPQKPKKTKRNWNDEGSVPYEKIPAFKAAQDCYKECMFRFRNVPNDGKAEALAVKRALMRTMVCIARARANLLAVEHLREAVDLAIEVQITLRVLVENNHINKKDFANISKHSDSLVRQMVGWSASEEEKKVKHPDLFTSQQ